MNLTAVSATAGGWLIAWPAAAATPATSNVNYNTGQTISNSAIIEVDNLGRIAVQAASGGTDVTIDIAGWYSDPPAVNYTYNPNGAQTTKTTTGAGAATVTYVWDQQGRLCNTINTTSPAATCQTATTVTRQRYTPYGAQRGTTTNKLDGTTERGFLGQTEDNNTNLTYLNNRYYDPNLTRFISVDPVTIMANPQTLNVYSYAGNSPATNSDPTGLCFGAADIGSLGIEVDFEVSCLDLDWAQRWP